MRKFVALLFVVLAFAACTKPDPYNTVIPQSEAAWETEFLPEVKKLGVPDQKLLSEYLARMKKSANPGQTGVPLGMTIRAAIAEQKKFDEEASIKAKKKKRADKPMNPGDAIIIRVASIRVVSDKDLPAYKQLLYQLVIENNGERSIAGVKGRVYLYDSAGREVTQLALNIDRNIKANSVAGMVWKQDFNQYADEDRAIAELATGKFRSAFIPETIVYANGKKLILLE